MTTDRSDRLRRTRTVRRSLVVGAVTASLGVTAACGLATHGTTASSGGTSGGTSGTSGTTGGTTGGATGGDDDRSQVPSQQGSTFQPAPAPQPGAGTAPQAQSSGS